MVLKTYAFTIKKLVKAKDRDTVSVLDYKDFLEELKCHGLVSYYEERDSKNRHHLHGCCELDSKFKYSTLKPKGFTTCFKPIYHIQGWLNYCKKDLKYSEQIIHDLTTNTMLKDYESQLISEKAHGQEDESLNTLRCLTPRTPKEFQVVIPKRKMF